MWFNVDPQGGGAVTGIFFYGRHSGPKELFQYLYQPKGGQVWYYDADRAPGGVAATPDAPPTR